MSACVRGAHRQEIVSNTDIRVHFISANSAALHKPISVLRAVQSALHASDYDNVLRSALQGLRSSHRCKHLDVQDLEKIVRCAQKEEIVDIATGVFATLDRHSSEFLPYDFAYVETEKLREKALKQ